MLVLLFLFDQDFCQDGQVSKAVKKNIFGLTGQERGSTYLLESRKVHPLRPPDLNDRVSKNFIQFNEFRLFFVKIGLNLSPV